MSWRALDNPLVWRTVTAVSIGRFCGAQARPSLETEPKEIPSTSPSSLLSNIDLAFGLLHSFASSTTCATQLEAHVPLKNPSPPTTISAPSIPTGAATTPTTTTTKSKLYDFVIVGNGTAGRSAAEVLREKCPGASIGLIDPLRKPPKQQQRNKKRIDFVQDAAISLDPRQRRIGMSSNNVIEYKYGVLLATGSHGAPPPSYLIDEQAHAKIWELRPTVLALQLGSCIPPTDIRTTAVQLAKKGHVIGILGSSWDAVDLAIATATVCQRSNRPNLFFGGSGPLSQTVPNYLSSAIAKRLKQKRVSIHDRTLIRYINHDEVDGDLQMYSAKSYDFLDSSRTSIDHLIVAPDTTGPRGNAALPTLNIPAHLLESRDGRFWYETWSQLCMSSKRDQSMIVCYKDDGRIAVNSELCAATGVYAAGSVAKCGNALTGHADVAGQGIHDASMAGRVAALNMARHFKQDGLFGFASDGQLPAVMRDAIPVWRSDILSYDDGQKRPTSFSSIGIHALCVGTCDSERCTTHGVWWTNQSAQQRILRILEQDEATYGDSNEMTPQQSKRRRKRLKESTKMVYGFGVVYYLDRTGRIQGVMTWGLPFAESTQDEINARLLERIKQVILSNGGMNSLETEFDQMRMSKYLAEESRALVALAFSESTTDAHGSSHNLDSGSGADFPRPLHRYTDNKHMSIRSHGVLKRKDGRGQGIMGEDLFSRFTQVVPDPSPPKPVTGGVGYASADAQGNKSLQAAWNWYDYQVFEQRERRWTENENTARPPKEDALWIRKGDESRSVSAADTRAAVMDSVVGVQRA